MAFVRFKLPEDILWQKLGHNEERVMENGNYWIVDKETGCKKKQLLASLDCSKLPILVSQSDQGGINRAGLDYMCHKIKVSIHIQFDAHHRAWNDVREACKKTKLFKTMLAFALLWNTSYGPFGSKEWHKKKRAKVADILHCCDPDSQEFRSFVPLIAQERGVPEPSTREERAAMLLSFKNLKGIRTLGPCVKLMRFFSWFECEKFHSGENWSAKFLMLYGEKSATIKPEDSITIPSQGLSEKQELSMLKSKHGTWALAPLLVTQTSMFEKQVIALIAQPCWTHHAQRAKHVLSPQQVASFTIGKACQGWKEELLDLVKQGFHSPFVLQSGFIVLLFSKVCTHLKPQGMRCKNAGSLCTSGSFANCLRREP